MSTIVFSEWVPAGSFVKIVFAFVMLVVFGVLSITSIAFHQPVLVVVAGSVMVFLVLLFWNYRGIHIQMSETRLAVAYGILNRKSIMLEEIVACQPTKASFSRYGGIGVRLGFDGSWAYTTSFGNAVEIERRKGRPFVFSSNNPEEICNFITNMKA